MIDFTLSRKQRELKEGIHNLGKYVVRPLSLQMDRNHEVPEDFLRNFVMMASRFRASVGQFGGGGGTSAEEKPREEKKPSEANRTAAIAAEELAWAGSVIAAFQLPENHGKGVIRVDGKMTELLHLEQAQRLVAIAERIASQP